MRSTISLLTQSPSAAIFSTFRNIHIRLKFLWLFLRPSAKLLDQINSQMIKNVNNLGPFFGRTLLIIDFVFCRQLFPTVIIFMRDIWLIPQQKDALFRNILLKGFADVVVTFIQCGRVW